MLAQRSARHARPAPPRGAALQPWRSTAERMHALVAAALLASLARGAHGACSYTLTLPSSGGGAGTPPAPVGVVGDTSTPSSGWCAPYALPSLATSPARCSGLTVPTNGVLAFGTCALPGAACSGATALNLVDAASGALLTAVNRVASTSAVAKLAQGCILGGRCSYGEWRNNALYPASVAVQELCYGDSACAGVVAWRISTTSTLSAAAALASPTPSALAFTLVATQAASVTSVRGTAPRNANVSIYGFAGNAYATGLPLTNVTQWQLLWTGTWANSSTPQTIALNTPLTLAANTQATLLVSTATGTLTCAHARGNVTSLLVSDTVLTVAQGGALNASTLFTAAAATVSPASACAWSGLSLAYTVGAATCSPPPAPQAPPMPTSSPDALVRSLDDLFRALMNPNVTNIEIRAHIALNGTQLPIAVNPSTNNRTLVMLGTNACQIANPATPLCTLNAGGLSRVLALPNGAMMRLGYLALSNGVAPAGGSGGCVLANCAGCALTLDNAVFTNCSASGSGGGVAVRGGATLVARSSTFGRNVAGSGAGMSVSGGTATVTGCTFVANVATSLSTASPVDAASLVGPSGAGLALVSTVAVVSGCTFANNTGATSDFVLVANPDLPQTRGGGLFVSGATVSVLSSTFTGNAAFYGGGVYAFNSTLNVTASALVLNTATLGDGGGLFASNIAGVVLINGTLVSSNSAGGHIGGGVAVLSSTLRVASSTFTANTAANGCGGGLGTDAYATLFVQNGTAMSLNSARDGGAVCCTLCTAMTVTDSFLFSNAALFGSGGAVLAASAPTALVPPVTFTNVSIRNNMAPQGGAASFVSASVWLTNCTLSGNTASTTHGGAVLHTAFETGKSDLAINNCTITGNTCEAGGGAVAAFNSRTVTILLSLLDNNTISSSSPAGGAVLLLNIQRFFLRNSTISNSNVTLTSALAPNAPLGFVPGVDALGLGFGGALWVGTTLPSTVNVYGMSFIGNVAPSAGAIYATGNVSLFVSQSSFYYNRATDYGGAGGAIVSDASALLDVSDTTFFGCEANKGGAVLHGGASVATYTRVTFQENNGLAGEDMKGTVMQVTDAATVTVADSLFLNNIGTGLAQGTVALTGANSSGLVITNSLFDGNFAYLGGCVFVSAYSQTQQLNMSGVTFRNSFAYVGSVLFTEATVYGPLSCSPDPCNATEANLASNYGQVAATPPTQFLINMPVNVRSGAPLPISVTLMDGFGQLVLDWVDTFVVIDTHAALSGSLRTFYASGQALFSGLVLRGNEMEAYNLTLTITGPNLFGNGLDSQSLTQSITVQACEAGETFDASISECACAAGYGVVVTDNTCRPCAADEVVPLGSSSCAACPALSVPISPNECECNAGYFGTIVGATGVCTQCAADMYRAAGDSPVQCTPCPETSHTFSLGAKSIAECLCAENTFNARAGDNNSFSCAAVPAGGWAPQADSRLFALTDYWRPGPEFTTFFECTTGMCRREEPLADPNATQLGYLCREGHTGHLCAVCTTGWAYQGKYCSKCNPIHRYSNWSAAKKGGLIFIGLALLTAFVFLVFFLPLSPKTERLLQRWSAPATQRIEQFLGNVAQAARAKTGRPLSAGGRPGSAGRRSERISARKSAGAADDGNEGLARTSRIVRRSSHTLKLPAGDGPAAPGDGSYVAPRIRVPRPSRLMVFLRAIQEPLRIVVTFWQIVSSFSANLYVPWPSIYYALANSLNVVSLQFLKLPAIACVQPEVSFYTVFNGVTLSCFIYICFCALTYFVGQRSAIAKADPERRRRFKTQCLSSFIWGIFLVYPQVSSTTLLIFNCTKLENDTYWLMADYRIQCYTPKHKLYIGVGAFWTLLLPFGLPAAFLYSLWQAKVPHLARWKRDCAWMRAIAQRALVLGAHTEESFDPDTLTLESISLEHLRVLHRLFVQDQPDATSIAGVTVPMRPVPTPQRTLGDALRTHLPALRAAAAEVNAAAEVEEGAEAGQSVRDGADAGASGSGADAGAVVTHHAPGVGRHSAMTDDASRGLFDRRRSSVGDEDSVKRRESSRRSSVRLRRTRSMLAKAAIPKNRLLAAIAKIGVQLAVTASLTNRGLRRSLSTFFYSNERELLIRQLLEWAKHTSECMVHEPRNNQLSWRVMHEWEALRAAGVPLGARDECERNAFYKFRFLFSGYAVHAWWWEIADMMQKLFLTSIIAFIAPHTSVQVIVACMWAFAYVLLTIQIRPYRERASNQLVSLSQVNIFLFLWTGLLLQTNPDEITRNRLLFAIVVGALTTSIVAMTFYLFIKELSRQLLNALIDIQDDEDEDEDEFDADTDEEDPAAGVLVVHRAEVSAVERTVWDDAGLLGGLGQDSDGDSDGGRDGANGGTGPSGAPASEEPHPTLSVAARPGGANTGTPPPPKWVARLASREASPRSAGLD